MNADSFAALARISLGLSLLWGIASLWTGQQWAFLLTQGGLAVALALISAQSLIYRIPQRVTPLLLLPLCAAALGALQLCLERSAAGWDTRRSALDWLAYTIAALVAYLLFENRDQRQFALRIFVGFATALSLYAVGQNYAAPGKVWFVFDTGYPADVFGPFLYHSKFCNWIELAFAPAVWLAMQTERNRSLYWSCAGLLFACAVASNSRGGLLFLTLEWLTLCFWMKHKIPNSKRIILAASMFPVLAIGSFLFGGEHLVERLHPALLARDGRFAIYASSIEILSHFSFAEWLLGAGMGSWAWLYPEFANFDNSTRINQAHSDWLQWTIEGGLPMLAIALTILWTGWKAALRQCWGLGFVFVWLHGCIDYPMQQTPALSVLQFAFWGMLLNELEKHPPGAQR